MDHKEDEKQTENVKLQKYLVVAVIIGNDNPISIRYYESKSVTELKRWFIAQGYYGDCLKRMQQWFNRTDTSMEWKKELAE
jgi:hypothetical protein